MMRGKKAVLICFSVKSGRFESRYERNKFFRELYGWKQTITKEKIVAGKPKVQKKVYTYRRGGLLDEVPHKRIDQSTFIVEPDCFDRIEQFFKEWDDKVIWRTFKVLLDEDLGDFFEKEEKV
jgi:hypothetical protein